MRQRALDFDPLPNIHARLSTDTVVCRRRPHRRRRVEPEWMISIIAILIVAVITWRISESKRNDN